jgi:hypothetical protein
MTAPGTTQTIEARLVRYLRKGTHRNVQENNWDIADQLETAVDPESTIDPPTLHSAFERLDESRSLFEFVGFVDEPEQADLLIDLSRWPILLEVLESQRDREIRRFQDLAVDSRMAPLEDDLRLFDALINSIQEKTGVPPRARDDQRSEPLARPAPARKRRRRGDE